MGSDSFDNPIFNICVKLFRSEDRQAYFAYKNQTGFVNFKKKKKKKKLLNVKNTKQNFLPIMLLIVLTESLVYQIFVEFC